MKTVQKWAVLFFILTVFLMTFGCSGGSSSDGSAHLSINLTDSPGDYLKVCITITGIQAIVEGSGPIDLEFADFDSPAVVEENNDSFTVDLIQLQDGDSIEIALGSLPAGKLNQLRLIVDAAAVYAYEDVLGIDGPDEGDEITHDEAKFPVKVPSGPQTGIKLNPRDIHLQSGSMTSLTLDFDADKSIVRLGSTGKLKKDEYYFILKPVIFILDAVGTERVDIETMAVNLDIPTGLQVAKDVGEGSLIGEGNVLVANEGSDTVVDIDVGSVSVTPIDASSLDPFASSADKAGDEPLVNSPSGVTQHLDLVWISNAASVVAADNAGTVSEIYTDGEFSSIYIDNDEPTDSDDGLKATSGIEFGGFAPNGSLADREFLVFETNGNGSITGLNIEELLIFDILVAASFSAPSDVAFIPTDFSLGDTTPAVMGWLYVTDAGANELVMLELTAVTPAAGVIGDSDVAVEVSGESTFTYTFLSEPVGVACNGERSRLYIANRGNGTIIAITPDGTLLETFDTGLGGSAINGIDAISETVDTWVDDTIYFTNTAADTLEKFVISW